MNLRGYFVEMIGTFLLVFCSAGTVIASYLASDHLSIGLVGIAVAQGAALAAILTFTLPTAEGCFNPAVTLALWVTRRFDFGRTMGLIAVQLVGAAFAGGILAAVFDQDTLTQAYSGTPHLQAFRELVAHDVTTGDWLVGSLAEAVLTFMLTLALLRSALDPRRPNWGALAAGAALTAGVLAGYHLTGASLNPARWFGTAIWQGNLPALDPKPVFRDHLPYWMGPTVGALLAAVVHAEWLKSAKKKA